MSARFRAARIRPTVGFTMEDRADRETIRCRWAAVRRASLVGLIITVPAAVASGMFALAFDALDVASLLILTVPGAPAALSAIAVLATPPARGGPLSTGRVLGALVVAPLVWLAVTFASLLTITGWMFST